MGFTQPASQTGARSAASVTLDTRGTSVTGVRVRAFQSISVQFPLLNL